MELRHLQTFIAITRTGSFSKAAQSLGYSQSAVTVQIRLLEQELNARLFDRMDRIMQADVIVVIAGMEGALASVVGGLVEVPVIAVPTSVGYGANFGGLAPLLSMLNCCANGIGVVNIDNGYGAACLATKICGKKAGCTDGKC